MKLRVNFSDMPKGFDNYNNCYYRNLSKIVDIEISEDPELLFYGPFGTDFLNYKKSILVFLADEPVLPNFNDCDYAIGSIDMRVGNRYFRRPPITGYGEVSDISLLSRPREISCELTERKFCNFVYSNESNGYGAMLRKQFCMNLSEYKRVDCPGTVLNNMENAIEDRYSKNSFLKKDINDNWVNSKIQFLKNYKFTIAFENVQMDGWTTEKLLHPFWANSIPIYWGNPKVADFFNTKAFIDCNEYENDLASVVKRIIELDNDDEQYLWMLKQSPIHVGYDAEWENKLVAFFKYIIENGRVEKNPIGFSSMSATDYPTLYRQGKIGLKSMMTMNIKCISGWMEYKIKRRKKV